MGTSVLISILILLLICVVAFYIIDRAFPGDVNWIAKLIVGIIALIALLKYIAFF